MTRFAKTLFSIVLLAFSASLWAQTYPAPCVKIIVPCGAGSRPRRRSALPKPVI
jgi:tripartite-type tricarboxylate transporter receptor subunit TctC